MPVSPQASKSNLRSYEAYLSQSPKAHIMFKAPLSRLRRRTSELMDQITGATVSEEVLREEAMIRDQHRKWRCRACDVVFAGEQELSKHLDLLPRHREIIEAKRTGRKPPKHSASASAGLTLPRAAGGGKAFTSVLDVAPGSQSPSVAELPHPTTRRSKTAAGVIHPSLHSKASLDDAFGALELSSPKVSHKSHRRPFPAFDAASPPRRRESPPPLIDYAARNEQQGRDSVRKRAESNKLHQMARAAHQAKQSQDLVDAATNGTTGVSAFVQGVRRGVSDGMIAAMAAMPTKAAHDAPAVQGPAVYFNREGDSTAVANAEPEHGADAESESDDDNSDFVSAVHGETPSLALAPTAISAQQCFDDVGSSLGHFSAQAGEMHSRTSASSESHASAQAAEAHLSGELPDPELTTTSRMDKSSTMSQAEAEPASREDIDWVPSSRPAPSPPALRMQMNSRAGSRRNSGLYTLSSPSSPSYSANVRPFVGREPSDGAPGPFSQAYGLADSPMPMHSETSPVPKRERRDTNPFRSLPQDAVPDGHQASAHLDSPAAPALSASATPSPASSPRNPSTPAALHTWLGSQEDVPGAAIWPPVAHLQTPQRTGTSTWSEATATGRQASMSLSQKLTNPYHSPPMYSPHDVQYGRSHYMPPSAQWSSSPPPMDTAVGAWAENYFANRDAPATHLADSPTIGLHANALQLDPDPRAKTQEDALRKRSSTLPTSAALPLPPSGAPSFPPLPLPPPPSSKGRRRAPPHLSPHARSASYSPAPLNPTTSYQVGRVHPIPTGSTEIRVHASQTEGAR